MALGTEMIILGIITLLIIYVWNQRRPKNFPPGPRLGFPILGHLPLLGLRPEQTLMKWKPKYGPIVGINFGSFPCVIISDYKLTKEAYNENGFAGRPKIPFTESWSNGKVEGILFSEGNSWQEQRRFTLRRLRDFGFGTKSMEGIVQEEIQELIERLKDEVETPISTNHRFNIAVVNALWTILTGGRFKHDDPELGKLIKIITASIGDNNAFTMLSSFVPWIAKYAPDFITNYKEVLEPARATKEFLLPKLNFHFKTHEPEHPRDFIDTYIDEMKRTTDPSSALHIDNKSHLLATLTDLFIAGAETTSTTLSWIFLYMATYPNVQEKLASEIQSVIGNSRLPSLNDRKDMPYTEAVIHEVMRATTLAPLAAFHSTMEHVSFHGYEIPKDTLIFINVYEAHNNEDYWGDPANFRPERFLTPDETGFCKKDAFMVFSVGKRVCPGETLARDELFLFTSSLFQVFKVSVDPKNPCPTLEPKTGGVYMPKPHTLVLSLRH